MSDALQRAWRYTWREIWRPTLDHPHCPTDASIEIYRLLASTAYCWPEYVKGVVVSDTLGDPLRAKQALKGFSVMKLRGDNSICRFFSDLGHRLNEDYESEELNSFYAGRVERFLERYNLSYLVCRNPFRVRPLLPIRFEEMYRTLMNKASGNVLLMNALGDFERAWSDHVHQDSEQDFATSISKASILAEAFVGESTGKHGKSLGDLCDILKSQGVFPHNTVKDAMKKLYGFCSDYPHIRHAGNPGSALRLLQARDTLFCSIVLVAFAAYAIDHP